MEKYYTIKSELWIFYTGNPIQFQLKTNLQNTI